MVFSFPLHVPVSIITLLLRIQLDHRVDSHDGNARLNRRLQLFDLAHARLEDPCFHAILHPALAEVKAVVLVALGLGQSLGVGVDGGLGRTTRSWRCWLSVGLRTAVCLWRRFGGPLRKGVTRSELCNEFGAVFRGVDGKGSWDAKQGGCKGTDGELLS